ncbi:acyl-CoA thioesterase-1 [Azotobacter beijerinckii]|uniref:Acyl-CoA thioesterase-1 n=1 Tax=Azotobacter beijerinckii TaxID=170623 RepID=A0A1H6R6V7_9GAMM|nr:arylesterase [Azotobacter beijerinckii]SEI46902.1 acyl-CoA thioesterase-1 [Azotobacter beijerinckii]SEI87137.1 acyl-CoA thioesterase-1 [Azotobacter beijerinckii]
MRGWLLGGALASLLWAQGALAGTVLVVGDSISAALGVETSRGWVALLEKRLAEHGLAHRVVNASISGDTSAGGLARLPGLLASYSPELVIIELGGNDGLRGQSPRQLQQNLAAMIDRAYSGGARVVLLGMQLPPNYGPRYNQAFSQVYATLAEEKQVPLVPFFLDGVGGVPGMMQADGIHPTAEAQPRMLDNLWPTLEPLL